MAQEIELKLAFAPAQRAALLRHPLLAQANKAAPTQILINTYFDTPDFALRAAKVAVRTRKAGRRWLQTVKCAAASLGGLASRPEWEQPYRNQRFDFSAVDHAPTAALLAAHAEAIVPVFTTSFKRETLAITAADGSVILAMIDIGEIEANGATEPICELELELAEGNPQHLLEIAITLAEQVPLLPENASKAERGFRLFRAEPRSAVRAARSTLQPGMSLDEAFKRLGFEMLNAWQANAGGALQHTEPEFTHQMRVALRRLRTLLRLFAPLLPDGQAAAWQDALGELAACTGRQRDLDVIGEVVIAPAQAHDAHALCETLRTQLDREATDSRAALLTLLSSPQAGVQMLRMAAFLHRAQIADTTPLTDFAALSLSALRKAVKAQHARALATGEEHALHALRIRLKRLRYTLEFFAPLFPGKDTLRYQKQLTHALDELGYLNDLASADQLLGEWAIHTSPAMPKLAEARAYLRGWHARRRHRVAARALARVGSLLDQGACWKALKHSGKKAGR